jgi:hypothetical protein
MADTTEGTTKKPAATAKTAARNRARSRPSRARTGGGGTAQRAGAAATATANAGEASDWNGLNRVVSRYLASHQNRSIGDTTIGELLAYAETRRPKTMTAGAGAGA